MTLFGACGFLVNDSQTLPRPPACAAPVLPEVLWASHPEAAQVAEQRPGVPSLWTPEAWAQSMQVTCPRPPPWVLESENGLLRVAILPLGGHPASVGSKDRAPGAGNQQAELSWASSRLLGMDTHRCGGRREQGLLVPWA